MFEDVINSFYDLPVDNKLAGYPVYPADYKGELPDPPFLKMNLVFSPSEAYATGTKKVSGTVITSIYYKSGGGQLLAASITGLLNPIFEQKLLSLGIQTWASSLQFLGTDKNDPSLSRADYSVPFSYYGE